MIVAIMEAARRLSPYHQAKALAILDSSGMPQGPWQGQRPEDIASTAEQLASRAESLEAQARRLRQEATKLADDAERDEVVEQALSDHTRKRPAPKPEP